MTTTAKHTFICTQTSNMCVYNKIFVFVAMNFKTFFGQIFKSNYVIWKKERAKEIEKSVINKKNLETF